MKVLHRPAMHTDAHRLFDIRRRSILDLASTGMSIAEASAWADRLTLAGMERKLRELEIWVAEASEGTAGWAAILADRLEGLYTAPEFAGTGVGTGLLKFVESLMRVRQIPAVSLEASGNAEAFYLRRGYERTGPPTSHGAYPMRKRLC